MRRTFLSLVAVGVATLMSQTASAACGSVTIADMNWASATFMAHVDKIILENGYGCDVSIVPGDTMPTFTSMNEKGEPDVAPEVWTNAMRGPLQIAFDEGRLHAANPNPITGLGEGWWIPPKTAEEHPELKTVLDIIEHPELFPYKEDPSKGAFVTCPAGWGCQLTNANLFRAFKMEEKGWVLVDPGSSAGLNGSIAKAADSGENWFGYYWSPTALIGKYNMVKVPFGVPFVGSKHWDGCIVKPEQDCANPKPTAWTKSEVNSIVTANFAKTGGKDALKYVEKRVFPGEVMNAMLVYMADNQAKGSDAAIEFLKQHEGVWGKWVSGSAKKKIKAGL